MKIYVRSYCLKGFFVNVKTCTNGIPAHQATDRHFRRTRFNLFSTNFSVWLNYSDGEDKMYYVLD